MNPTKHNRKTCAARLAGTLILLALTAMPAQATDLPPLSSQLTRLPAKPAPALKLKDLNGRLHDLSQLRGRVVLVNFWATWCPPCRREMPSMQRLLHALGDKTFAVLAVNVGENAETIELFTSQLDTAPAFPILLDSRSLALQAWQVAGLPTTFLVDKRGRIVASAIGGREFDHPEMIQAIKALIRE